MIRVISTTSLMSRYVSISVVSGGNAVLSLCEVEVLTAPADIVSALQCGRGKEGRVEVVGGQCLLIDSFNNKRNFQDTLEFCRKQGMGVLHQTGEQHKKAYRHAR